MVPGARTLVLYYSFIFALPSFPDWVFFAYRYPVWVKFTSLVPRHVPRQVLMRMFPGE